VWVPGEWGAVVWVVDGVGGGGGFFVGGGGVQVCV